MLFAGRINQQLYENICHGLSGLVQNCQLFYDWPSDQTLADSDDTIFIGKWYITILHNQKKRSWRITSWGTFYENYFSVSSNNYLDNGCSSEVAIKMRSVSNLYLRQNNARSAKENFAFDKLNGWKYDLENQEIKNFKALQYLLTKITTKERLEGMSLVYFILDIIFFKDQFTAFSFNPKSSTWILYIGNDKLSDISRSALYWPVQ